MTRQRWKRFLSYYRPHLRTFLCVLSGAFIAAGIDLVFPLFAQHIADTSFGAKAVPVSASLLWSMAALAVIELFASFYQDARGHALGAAMENTLREEFFGHLLDLPFSFYDKHPVGDLMSRLTNDLLDLTELYHHGPEDYIVNAVKCIGAFVILLSINATLAFLLFGILVLLGIWTVVTSRRVAQASFRFQEQIGHVNAMAEDTLQNIRTVQSFCAEDSFRQRFSLLARSFYQSRTGIYHAEAIAYQGMSFIARGIRIAVFFVGGILAVSGRINTAGFIAFLLYAGYLIEPVQHLAWMTTQYHRGLAGFSRVMDIMDITADAPDAEASVSCGRLQGEISLEGVHFAYEGIATEVLQGVDLHIDKGETVALVGTSGIGKTTLLQLLSRFYESSAGRITIDGMDIRHLTRPSLRANIAIVSEDSALFDGTIAQNIALGKPHATTEEITHAAMQADAHGFIADLPKGYESNVGPHGALLSAGQKQRICIARAFLQDAPILILDEATSVLDAQSEARIQETLSRLSQGRTTIIVAHRLSAIRSVPRICVLSEGRIVEEGSHDILVEKDGIYASLYRQMYSL